MISHRNEVLESLAAPWYVTEVVIAALRSESLTGASMYVRLLFLCTRAEFQTVQLLTAIVVSVSS